MATKEFTNNELNYFRLCYVITRIVPDGLRTVFKQEWDTRYKATHGQWQDMAKNAIDFYNMESAKNKKRKARELTVMANGNTSEWDCTCLFYAILYSDSLGSSLNTAVKKSVDELREVRNEVFAHTFDGSLTDVDFQNSIQKIVDAFKTLGLNSSLVDEIKIQTSFPTKELGNIKQLFYAEKKRFAKFQSFCVLPPKPSHDTTNRLKEVSTICQQMEKLRNAKKNEMTIIYLSGNPGCGKSELARQIGEKYFNEIPVETAERKFVFTLNVSSIDTLLQSYVNFAGRLSCDEDSVSRIATSKDFSTEEKIKSIRSLVNSKVQIYSSWLIIVDNVINLKLISRYLPQAGEKTSGDGQILVTTQDRQSIPCDPYTYHLTLSLGMNEEDAIASLWKISRLTGDREIAIKVAKALDFQPLALACAAIYMQRIRSSSTQSKTNWEKYLLKLQEGKREATETAYKNTSLTYSATMTTAVRFALEREASEDKIMMHAFQFLSIIASEPIPLKYVVQYVINCMPDQDEDLVGSHICLSSLVISSEEESKEIRVHQVVYKCIQTNITGGKKKEETGVYDVILAFSTFVLFDLNKTNDIIVTRPLVSHFVTISINIRNSITAVEHYPSSIEKMVHRTECVSKIGQLCFMHGNYKASETFFQICLTIQMCAHDKEDLSVAVTLNDLSNCLYELGNYEKAKECLERALSIEENNRDGNYEKFTYNLGFKPIASVERNMAIWYHLVSFNLMPIACFSRYPNGETCLGRELAIHQNMADTLNNLGNCFVKIGQQVKARASFEKAKEIYEDLYATNNNLKLASTLNNLGNCLTKLGHFQEGKTCLEKALSIEEKVYDANHPHLAATFNNLGNCYMDLKQYEKAKACLEKALAIDEDVYHTIHPKLAGTLNNLGNCLSELGEHENAKLCLERAMAIKENAYDANHPNFTSTLNNLGNCLTKLGQYQKAKTYFERAVENEENAYAKNYEKLVATLKNLGNCLTKLEQYEEARQCLVRAQMMYDKIVDANPLSLADILYDLSGCLVKLGRYKEAKSCSERALTIYENIYGANHPALKGLKGHMTRRRCTIL